MNLKPRMVNLRPGGQRHTDSSRTTWRAGRHARPPPVFHMLGLGTGKTHLGLKTAGPSPALFALLGDERMATVFSTPRPRCPVTRKDALDGAWG